MKPEVKHARVWLAIVYFLFVVAFTLAVFEESRRQGREADEKIIRAQIASCERVNELRRRFNARGDAVQRFVTDARRIEPKLAVPLVELARHFDTIPLADCPVVVRAG